MHTYGDMSRMHTQMYSEQVASSAQRLETASFFILEHDGYLAENLDLIYHAMQVCIANVDRPL